MDKKTAAKDQRQSKIKPKLPHGWTVHTSKTYPDRVYYFNEVSGCTTWEMPILENVADKPNVDRHLKNTPVSGVATKAATCGQLQSTCSKRSIQPVQNVKTTLRTNAINKLDEVKKNAIEKSYNKKNVDGEAAVRKHIHQIDASKRLPSLHARPTQPVKPAIKNYLDGSVQKPKKNKSSVRFEETSSPTFSPAEYSSDEGSCSPRGFQEVFPDSSKDYNNDEDTHCPSSFQEESQDSSSTNQPSITDDCQMPPSPTESSIYTRILNESPSNKNFISSTASPKSSCDLQICKPFIVRQVKKLNQVNFFKQFEIPAGEKHAIELSLPIDKVQAQSVSETPSQELTGALVNHIDSNVPSSIEQIQEMRIDNDEMMMVDKDFILWDTGVENSHKTQTMCQKTNCDNSVKMLNLGETAHTSSFDNFFKFGSSNIENQYSCNFGNSFKTDTIGPKTNLFSLSDSLKSHNAEEKSGAVGSADSLKLHGTEENIFPASFNDSLKPCNAEKNSNFIKEVKISALKSSSPKETDRSPKKRKCDEETLNTQRSCNPEPRKRSKRASTDTRSPNDNSNIMKNIAKVSTLWESLITPPPSAQSSSTSSQSGRSFGDHWSGPHSNENEEDSMEWEPQNVENTNEDSKDSLYSNFSTTSWHVVIDTNILLQDLKYVQELRDTLFEGVGCPVIVIPWVVLQELDQLKTQIKNGVNKKAQAAVSFILDNLSSGHPRFKGQSYDEFHQHKFTSCSNNDDKILHFCSSLQKKGCHVTLLTEDKNLRNKAIISRIVASSKTEVYKKCKKICTNLGDTVMSSDVSFAANPMGQHDDSQKAEWVKADKIFCKSKAIMYKVLKQVLVQGMKKLSTTMWQRMVVKKPPWSLRDVLFCMRHHWMAVFHDEFPCNAENLIAELDKQCQTMKAFGNSLQEMKDHVETCLSLCLCVAPKENNGRLVSRSISGLKELLVACHGTNLLVSINEQSSDDSEELSYADTKTNEDDQTDESELQGVQNHFTALWERINAFSEKVIAMMTDGKVSPPLVTEVEANISSTLRTVKQFLQLNKKLLANDVTENGTSIQEMLSILLGESTSDFHEDAFTDDSLVQFYNERRGDLEEAQNQFQKFLVVMNSGIRFLMSKNK